MSFRWVPNALTIMRCFGAFVVGWAIWRYGEEPADTLVVIGPFILFVLVAASDFLDGYFARKLNAVSAFGAFLDPVADKLLVAVSLIAIAYVNGWSWVILLPAFIIIARDSYVTVLRLVPNVKLPVTTLAKYKTALEMAGIGGLLFVWVLPALGMGGLHGVLSYAALALIYLAAALSAYTGWLYVRSALTGRG